MEATSEAIEHEWPYRASWMGIIGGVIFFGGGAAASAWWALSNRRGMNLFRLVELDPTETTYFLWALSATSVGFVIMIGAIGWRRLMTRQRVALTGTQLLAPAAPWSSKEKHIPYTAISELATVKLMDEPRLRIMYNDGHLDVPADMMPSRVAFREFCQVLAEKVAGAHRNTGR